MKKYLMLGAAAMMLMTVSCSKDKDMYNPDQTKAYYRAGFEEVVAQVNENQDWKTIAEREANITVNLGLDQEYTVAIYNANPLFDRSASLLAMKTVKEGGTMNVKFEAAISQEDFFIGVFDTKGRGVSKTVSLDGDKLVANIGTVTARSRTRAIEADYTTTYAKTAQDYLHDLTVADMKNYTPLTDEAIRTKFGDKSLQNPTYEVGTGKPIQYGDGFHYIVESGVEITEIFHSNGISAASGWQPMFDGAVVYIEGKVHLSTNTLNSTTIVVGNGGEAVLDGEVNMSNTGRFVVLGGGKITGADGASLKVNNGGQSYNAGIINFKGELNINGSDFYNNGTLNVSLLRNTSGGKITNFGSITAGTNINAADAYNCEMINGCYWHYTGDAGIGRLTMLDNSRLDVDGRAEFTQSHYQQDEPIDLDAATPNILMANSVISVKDAYCTNTIFQGPDNVGELGIVQIKGKLMVGRALDVLQFDNCYFDWDSEEIYNKESVKQTLAMEDGIHGIYSGVHQNIIMFISEASSPISIEPSECTGAGYNPKGEPVVIPTAPVYYSIAFEDLGSTKDFDFNDIVLYVALNTTTHKAKVSLMAAGGILPIEVYYGDTKIFEKTSTQMMNTFSKGSVIAETTEDITMTTPIADLEKFSVKVIDGDKSVMIESALAKGKAPMALIIPNQWAWPSEYTSILDAYPLFRAWVKSSTDNGWYNSPVEGKVIK